MWTAIVFFLLISFCICEHRFSVLKGRGVHVVRINRLTTEKQCRQACQSPDASGNHHCNWSVPYQNCCILLQCHQLSMCQNAEEQDIKDLLGEIVGEKVETVLFHHQSYPQKKERMAYESYKKKDYTQVDYLINGIAECSHLSQSALELTDPKLTTRFCGVEWKLVKLHWFFFSLKRGLTTRNQ
ncbi:hypothetical protein AV530_013197 [Patagioenas fasciata monilis]|uniref:Uncharacterized protein n=1 Tax=Patagioenas fasciata monilis TaxID=372326 RepID=A0A1V4JNP0_PATFA|nr:hypothetical protein AV530_013197 [Patagioenas fasciata monilis]